METLGEDEKALAEHSYSVIDLRARDLCPFFTLLLCFCAGDVLPPH